MNSQARKARNDSRKPFKSSVTEVEKVKRIPKRLPPISTIGLRFQELEHKHDTVPQYPTQLHHHEHLRNPHHPFHEHPDHNIILPRFNAQLPGKDALSIKFNNGAKLGRELTY